MTLKFPSWLSIVAVTLTGFAIALGLNFPRNEKPSEPSEQNALHTAATSPSSAEFRRTAVNSSAATEYAFRGSESSAAMPPPTQSSSKARDLAKSEDSQFERTPTAERDEHDTETVIGRPFPVSPSIERLCRKNSSKKEDYCAVTHRALAEFAQQPRDPAWASRIETQLHDLVMAQPGYTIRGIECRTSICVAEVASMYGMFHFVRAIGLDSPLHKSLMEGMGETAYERDQSSASVTVTLMTFERR